MYRTHFSFHRAFYLLTASLCSLAATFVFKLDTPVVKVSDTKTSPSTEEKAVLGAQTPIIYISGGGSGYGGGGLITLASTDEPAIKVGGYSLNKNVDITIYKADQNAVIDYLTHNKDGNQTIKPDLGKFQQLGKTSVSASSDGTNLPLPNSDTNVWFVRATYEKVISDSIVVRSGFGVLSKQGDNELIFWGQDYASGRSITSGDIKLLNLLDGRKEIATASFSSDGIAKMPVSKDADVALATIGSDFAIIPLNLRYLNIGYNYAAFTPKSINSRFFTYTDRPLYRPGDKVYFKSIIRDDDDARYTIPKGTASVKVTAGGSDKPFYEKNLNISPDGTVFGEIQLPEDAPTGYFSMVIERSGEDQSYTAFNVEFFRKPEYSIDVTIPKTEFISGDKPSFEVSGNYFSGQPLTTGEVRYYVRAANYYDYEYMSENRGLSDAYRYGYWGNEEIMKGSANFDSTGKFLVDVDTLAKHDGSNKIYSFEATYDNGSGNPAFSRKNILVYAGEFNIFRGEGSYSAKINSKTELPIVLVPNTKTKINGVKLSAKITREEWVKKDDGTKYGTYEKVIDEIGENTVTTDDKGKAIFSFTPVRSGYYRFEVSATDQRGNKVAKAFGIYVTDKDYAYYSEGRNNDLVITQDKKSYLPSDTATLSISSTIPDRDVFLSFERGRLNRYQIIHLTGRSTQVEVPLTSTDTPNIFAVVSSFSKDWLNTNTANLLVPADHKLIQVKITPDKETYGPADTVNLNIDTTDKAGNPVAADLGIWSVDKALFELADSQTPDIFNTFWFERWNNTQTSHSLEGIFSQGGAERGGCFAAGTKVLMADGKTKSIEKIKIGDQISTLDEKTNQTVKAKVTRVHEASSDGYLIINGSLKLTPNHIIRVNGAWAEASMVQIGDRLTDSSGKDVLVTSYEWLGLKVPVYNLEVEKYHTYIADGYWVHNQKGDTRSVFKDTAYWNPAFHTDSSGRGKVTFKLPDNLTTWVIAAVADTVDTKVGQTTREIVVSKDVIIRPTLPNILRVGDEVTLTALVQNFTSKSQSFEVSLGFDAGQVDSPNQTVEIKPNESTTVKWNVRVNNENNTSKLTYSVKSKDDPKAADTVILPIKVISFGFTDQKSFVGNGQANFDVKLSPDIDKTKSSATLYLSSTLLGSLPAAMSYLIDYPYGCVEQTTSKLIPAIIAKLNKNIFADAIEDKNIEEIIEVGVKRLGELQQMNGGWSWWRAGNSDPFITSYVLEYLRLAKSSGSKVPDEIIERGKSYLTSINTKDTSEEIMKAYGLSLFGIKTSLPNLDNLQPDLLALAVITNANNGDKNPSTNGLTKLMNMAKVQGESIYWESGDKVHFDSVESSTSLAIRAILVGGGNRDEAVRAANMLMKNRKTHYWSNTFATAQVIRSITDLANSGSEITPDYNYTVTQDNKTIKNGTAKDASVAIKPVKLNLKDLKSFETTVGLSLEGKGQLYSNLIVKEFHTDIRAKAVNNGLVVKREYRNEKGDEYSLSVGDTVDVVVTIEGLNTPENYAVIEDQLPAGMIPINTGFKNEQASQDQNYYYNEYGVTDRDYTENGVILSLYRMNTGRHEYSYKARVISAGKYSVPPVTASLMYSPEISGRSEAQTVTITEKSEVIPGRMIAKTLRDDGPNLLVNAMKVLVGLIVVWGFAIIYKKVFKKNKKTSTPTEVK